MASRVVRSTDISPPDSPATADFEILVDATGHRCPIPTLRLRRALAAAAAGTRLRLLTDDPMARIDVAHFAAEAGVEILATGNDGAATSFLLRKA